MARAWDTSFLVCGFGCGCECGVGVVNVDVDEVDLVVDDHLVVLVLLVV